MMKFILKIKPVFSLCCLLWVVAIAFGQKTDYRNIATGHPIFTNGYMDQPYVVVLQNGNWLCVFTTGAGKESHAGQHIVSMVSGDKGKTWSPPVDIEPSTGPAASWATPYITDFGRVYVFYSYNGDNINTLNGKTITHNSELGWYCYKYSDDNGQTWSKRYRLPLPKAPVDFKNDFKGEVQLFWGIDKPKTIGSSMMFAFTRLGKYVQSDGEGWFYRSNNIRTEKNADKLHFELLPDGEVGLKNPAYGSIQEEHNTVPLSNGDIYCMYRTTLGFPVHSYSRDGGHTWTMPVAATYEPQGKDALRNPRACPRVFRCGNGKYLFWYHHHGGKGYQGRNPVWISGGIEKNGFIHWSQPEILLYSIDTTIQGMSYPDLVQQDGKFWFTETQKTIARVHPVAQQLLEGMWQQGVAKSVVRKGLIYDKAVKENKVKIRNRLPVLKGGGISIAMWIHLKEWKPGQVILDNFDENSKGIRITTTPHKTLKIELSDGFVTDSWDTDPGALEARKLHHVVFIADGLANIISTVVDGKLGDGGSTRLFGWARLTGELNDINGNTYWKSDKAVKYLRLYNRYITTSEAISNFNAGLKQSSTQSRDVKY